MTYPICATKAGSMFQERLVKRASGTAFGCLRKEGPWEGTD